MATKIFWEVFGVLKPEPSFYEHLNHGAQLRGGVLTKLILWHSKKIPLWVHYRSREAVVSQNTVAKRLFLRKFENVAA